VASSASISAGASAEIPFPLVVSHAPVVVAFWEARHVFVIDAREDPAEHLNAGGRQ